MIVVVVSALLGEMRLPFFWGGGDGRWKVFLVTIKKERAIGKLISWNMTVI